MNDLTIMTPEVILQGLEEASRKGPPKVAPEDIPKLIHKWRGVLERMGGQREIFRWIVSTGQNRRQDGSLMTYREIEEEMRGSRSYRTLTRWMWEDFPEVAQAMAQARGGHV